MTTSIKKEHVKIPAGSKYGYVLDLGVRVRRVAGVNTDETMTITGANVGDMVLGATDWTDFGSVDFNKFSGQIELKFTAPNELTYSGAKDYTGKNLQIWWCQLNDD